MINVISEEIANEQIESLKAYYDIEVDDFPKDVKAAVVSSFKKVRRAIMAGRLEIDTAGDDIVIKQTLAKPPEGSDGQIVYKEVSGVAKDGLNDDHSSHKKMYYFLGVLSGQGAQIIRKLKGPDLSVAEALGCIFLQV